MNNNIDTTEDLENELFEHYKIWHLQRARVLRIDKYLMNMDSECDSKQKSRMRHCRRYLCEWSSRKIEL
jgi:hypothetical protein